VLTRCPGASVPARTQAQHPARCTYQRRRAVCALRRPISAYVCAYAVHAVRACRTFVPRTINLPPGRAEPYACVPRAVAQVERLASQYFFEMHADRKDMASFPSVQKKLCAPGTGTAHNRTCEPLLSFFEYAASHAGVPLSQPLPLPLPLPLSLPLALALPLVLYPYP
jgi:hypothetical protein